MSDYTEYLPYIDVNDGKARVVNNLKLYMRLLGKFAGSQMSDDIIHAMGENDSVKIAQTAHALRGTSANLSFPELLKVTAEIEALAKKGEDCSHLVEPLKTAMSDVDGAIQKLLAAQG